MKAEIHYVMHYLYLKGYTARAAMDEIHSTYDTVYPSYSVAKECFQKFKNPEITPSESQKQDSPQKMKKMNQIQGVLQNKPNASVRLIAEQTQIPKTSVHRLLVSDMGLKFRVPKEVPHLLNYELKRKRIQQSIELLKVLEDPLIHPHQIITGDEAWLEWTGRIFGRWQREEEPPPFSPKRTQTIKKTMIIAFFSFSEILVVDFLKQGITNNATYMCANIWPAIDQKLRKKRPKSGAHGIFLHFDNASIHKSQESKQKINELGFILLEHPPYSPDIAPSDFWLFRFLDEKRKGTVASNEDELIFQTREILSKIDSTVLVTVFKEWIKRLHMVIESDGEYLLS